MPTLLARLRKGAADSVTALTEAGEAVARDVADAASETAEGTKDVAADARRTVVRTADRAARDGRDRVDETRHGLAGAAAGAFEGLRQGLGKGADRVATTVSDATTSASGAVIDASGRTMEAATDAAETAGVTMTEVVATVVDKLVELAEAMGERLGDAADDAAGAGRSTARSIDGRVDDLRGSAERATRTVEATLADAKARVTDGAPLDDVVRRLERRWPGTDEDRYDRAYERGYARGRSGKLAVGLAVGATAAAAGTWLLDPERGAARRAQITKTARDTFERARRELETRGIVLPGSSGVVAPQKLLPATASPGAIGETPNQRTASTETTSLTADPLREPVAAGTIAAEGIDGIDTDAERGTWHKDLAEG